MSDESDILRRDKGALLDALRDARADVSTPSRFKCPFHEDGHPSAGIYEKDGVWRFKCQAKECGVSGDVFDIRAKVRGTTVADELRKVSESHESVKADKWWPNAKVWAKAMNAADLYEYTNPDTKAVELLKVRIERHDGTKLFLQAHIGTDGRVYCKAPPKPWPIFNRTYIKPHSQVIICEGEKVTKALRAAGVAATCAATGGRKGGAADCDWKPLAGKTCILWPDNDETGIEHMKEVAEQLRQLDPKPKLWWLDPNQLGLTEKQDAYDYLAKFDEGKADALSDAIDLAKPMDEKSSLRAFLDDIMAGKWACEPLPYFPILDSLARPLLPGCVWVIVGDPGATKSMFLMMLVGGLVLQNGTKTACFMLEDYKAFHMLRAMAQVTGEARVTDDRWIAKHEEIVNQLHAKHEAALDSIEGSMSDAPDDSPTYATILDWMGKKLEAGTRVLMIDPVTAIDSGAKPWEADRDFMAKAKGLLRKYGASLVLVTHPRNGNSKADIDDLAGSRAFGRFAQCVTWLKSYPEGKGVELRVKDEAGITRSIECSIDREVMMRKTRNARGQGLSIGMQFNANNLTFAERGIVKRVLKKHEDGGVE